MNWNQIYSLKSYYEYIYTFPIESPIDKILPSGLNLVEIKLQLSEFSSLFSLFLHNLSSELALK